MARTLETIVDFMRYIVRKERGVFLTTDEAALNLDTGQMDAFEEWFEPYGTTQQVHDALRPFRKSLNSFTSDFAGYVTYPPDYMHLLGQPFTIAGSTVCRVEFCNEDELPFALTSQLRPVSNTYPIAIDTAAGFVIYPQAVQVGYLNYLRRPISPIYATIVSGRQVLFDAANSVNLEWGDQYINHIIAKALKYSAINMAEADIYQFAEQYDKETQ